MSQTLGDNQSKWDATSRNRDMQLETGTAGFAGRFIARVERLGFSDAELSRRSGVPTSTLSRYRKGEGVPKAEHLFPLSDALSVDPRWLVSGVETPRALIDAADAEWENVPFFDLRNITDTGKGEPDSWTPFRRDWLNRALGTAVELYLVQLRSGYRSRLGDKDLHEGDLVFCRECEPSDLEDGYIVIWRRENGLKVARYSLRQRENVDEDVITPAEVSDDQFVPIARILGKYLQRV